MQPIEYVDSRIIKEFASDSNPTVKYQVREGKDGRVYCTCWAWRRSPPNNKDCKHLRRIRDVFESDRSDFRKSFGGGK